MRHNHNSQSLPFGMSNVSNPAHIQAASFFYGIYPGIHKFRIKGGSHRHSTVRIKVMSGTDVHRSKTVTGADLMDAMGKLWNAIRTDDDMYRRLLHPEEFAC